MIRVVIIISLLFIQIIFVHGQDNEIIFFEDLKFNSDFEKKTFEQIKEGEINLFRLFAAIDPDLTENIFNEFEKEISQALSQLNSKKFSKSKAQKKIVLLYEFVNERKLFRYQEKTLFPHLFVNGTFNCLTASAYYGFLMDSLGIEYEFMETTNHVHPVAYPSDLQIKIETTDRISGIKYYDEKLKSKFVSYLVESSIITKDEYFRKSVDQLFFEYFFPESSIGMKELAGLHYMNDALYNFYISDKNKAYDQIKKAYYLYPSQRMLALLQFILAEYILNSEFDQISDVKIFVLLSRFSDDRIDQKSILNLFLYFTDLVLIKNKRPDLYDDSFYYLMENLNESKLKTDIEFQYNFLRGSSLISDFKFAEGLELIENAFKIYPHNSEIQAIMVSNFAYIFYNSPTPEILYQLEDYEKDFPEIKNNGAYISLRMNGYLIIAQQFFDLRKEKEGLDSLNKFEKLFLENPGIEFEKALVAEAYSSAATYYFKNYNNKKAKEYLERGLQYSPDNFELQFRLKNI